jgi:LacI family transcriptional regulator
MRENRSTIYDVASKAGVSIATVSRYLNNSNNVKDSTGLKIAEAMEFLDYIPQGNTGSRASRTFGRIGILTPFFPAPSFVERLGGVIPPLKQKNFEVIIYTVEGPEQLDEYLTSVPFTRRIDGLILMSVRLSPEQQRTLKASNLNVVMIESDEENYSRVLADDYRGGQLAAELFLKKNYFPCLYMGDESHSLSYSCHPSENRLKGFRETLKKGGYDLKSAMVLESETTVDGSQKIFGSYLDKSECPRAVFAMSDMQAIGIMKAAKKRNIRIPEELAVLGFDNIEASDWLELSSISQHLEDSGRIAAGLLLEKLTGTGQAIQNINLQVCLIERSTT